MLPKTAADDASGGPPGRKLPDEVRARIRRLNHGIRSEDVHVDCAVGSNSRNNSPGVRPAHTNSTSCCRNSGECGGLNLGIADSSLYPVPVPAKAGQLR
jgi:hypothetical protein